MITKIKLFKVASYKKQTVLETDKKINLIYGLNGTGKTTFSDFLYNSSDSKYSECQIDSLNPDDEVLVYNQKFVKDNFHENEMLKGIFTLSSENKVAETNILNSEKEIQKLNEEKKKLSEKKESESKLILEKQESIKDQVWEIKKKHSGGDKVLDFCLDGFKNDGNKLLNYLLTLPKPTSIPKTIEEIKQEVREVADENAAKYDLIPLVKNTFEFIENHKIFSEAIIGNENSTIAELIIKLGNSDWVLEGLHYITSDGKENLKLCPFCQSKTISETLQENFREYFNETYSKNVELLKTLFEKYSNEFSHIENLALDENLNNFKSLREEFFNIRKELLVILGENSNTIKSKIENPSVPVTLKYSKDSFNNLNSKIEEINIQILDHNKKIEDKEKTLEDLKISFWQLMRLEYDSQIQSLTAEKLKYSKSELTINNEISIISGKIDIENRNIAENQKLTVNISEAIEKINGSLLELGIENIRIAHQVDNYYKIVRDSDDAKIFTSLSEGEKMIISFLYFLELCRGKKDAKEGKKNKIIIIDDPISSLSHIYVFNIGRLIKNEFFGIKIPNASKPDNPEWDYNYDQVFILTHSLYFFYEITETNHKDRKLTQNLYRLIKNSEGSMIVSMKYEEIQNDYQAYWYIIRDQNQPVALIANCMRNIVEYFFNFVEKKDLNNFFRKPEMQVNRFQAFYRYINRESHSLGQNIADFKEFNYNDIKDAFALLFEVTGYYDHYRKMMQ